MIYFIADTHFMHQNIVTFCKRPFANVKEMDEELIRRWNSVVRPNDTVYVLGDFSLNCARGVELEEIFSRLNGHKHLIIGNHDIKNKTVMSLPWESKELLKTINADNRKFVLCHYPIESWDCRRYGAYHLFGHVHNCETTMDIPRRMCVSVEQIDYTPISLDEVVKRCEARHSPSPLDTLPKTMEV